MMIIIWITIVSMHGFSNLYSLSMIDFPTMPTIVLEYFYPYLIKIMNFFGRISKEILNGI